MIKLIKHRGLKYKAIQRLTSRWVCMVLRTRMWLLGLTFYTKYRRKIDRKYLMH